MLFRKSKSTPKKVDVTYSYKSKIEHLLLLCAFFFNPIPAIYFNFRFSIYPIL